MLTFEAVPLVAGPLGLGRGEVYVLGPGEEQVEEGVTVQPAVAREHLPHPPAAHSNRGPCGSQLTS